MTTYPEIKIQEIVPKSIGEKHFEIHRFHRDIFIIIEGEAMFQSALTYKATGPYDEEKDVQKAEAAAYKTVIVKVGEGISFEPDEPHKPLLLAGSRTVRFVILKEHAR